MKKLLFLSLLFLLALSANGQKKPLDHSVYDDWKSVGAITMTTDNKYALFNINPQEGDATLVSLDLTNLSQDIIPRGTSLRLTRDSKYAVMNIRPLFQQTREARIKRLPQNQMPRDSVGIYNLQTKTLKKIPHLRNFKMGTYATDFFAFQTTPPADTSSRERPARRETNEGEDLMVYQFSTGNIDTLKFVSDYQFSRGGDSLFVIVRPNSRDTLHTAGMFLYLPKSKSMTELYKFHLKQSIKLPYVSEDNKHLLFFANLDTVKEREKYISIVHYSSGSAQVVVDNSIRGLPTGHRVSDQRNLQMDKNGTRIFFGIAPILPEKDTTIAEIDQAKLDIWHWQEPYVQPVQLRNLQRDLNRTYLCKIEINNPVLVQLSKDEYDNVTIPDDMSANWAYALSDYEYRVESQWRSDPRRDLYLINVSDGSSRLLLKDRYISSASASPEAKYLVWYDADGMQWYSYDVASGATVHITAGLNVSFANELQDTPQMPGSYNQAGWIEGDKAIFINDRYDVWQIDPTGKAAAINLTDGLGRKEDKTFRISRLELPPAAGGGTGGGAGAGGGTGGGRGRETIKPNQIVYFSVSDNITKEDGYYYKDLSRRNAAMTRWVLEPVVFSSTVKAQQGNTIIYVKSSFTDSPDVWITKDNFKTQTKVTDINPQQRDYNWGTSELVKWTSSNGIELEGILYKPEDFNPARKYPMIVYFYERSANTLYNYRAPAPSRSTVNISYFVSNGYLLFVPDIVYQTGRPGQDALDCIVPGVEMLCENSWVDRDNVAIQGQSWGGYQVAYMVTQPERFKWKAASAGAPVANMTSAYGGIRWGTGLVRQFQYEQTQSRIGKTMWDEGGLQLYINNSPLFFADKVVTPLLIMSNDQDDAVPWYQGIEYFTALRRLGKPAWLLQYNNEVHNLGQRVNAKDLSVRLAQFFDHYLKGAPMPVWMKTGVPATMKGIDWGFGY